MSIKAKKGPLAVWGIMSTAAVCVAPALSHSMPKEPVPLRIHKELATAYPAYAAKLATFNVQASKPDSVESSSYNSNPSYPDSITYQLGPCALLPSDWQRQIWYSLPPDPRAVKFAKDIPRTSSVPEEAEGMSLHMTGRDLLLINASGFSRAGFLTNYISLRCNP